MPSGMNTGQGMI